MGACPVSTGYDFNRCGHHFVHPAVKTTFSIEDDGALISLCDLASPADMFFFSHPRASSPCGHGSSLARSQVFFAGSDQDHLAFCVDDQAFPLNDSWSTERAAGRTEEGAHIKASQHHAKQANYAAASSNMQNFASPPNHPSEFATLAEDNNPYAKPYRLQSRGASLNSSTRTRNSQRAGPPPAMPAGPSTLSAPPSPGWRATSFPAAPIARHIKHKSNAAKPTTSATVGKQHKVCFYEQCPSPLQSNKWRIVTAGTTAGSRAWGELVGKTLCDSCYSTFRKHGTLVRSVRTPEGWARLDGDGIVYRPNNAKGAGRKRQTPGDGSGLAKRKRSPQPMSTPPESNGDDHTSSSVPVDDNLSVNDDEGTCPSVSSAAYYDDITDDAASWDREEEARSERCTRADTEIMCDEAYPRF